MTKSRALFLALVVALLGALIAPVGAQSSGDPRAKRDELRKKRADLAAQLDTIKASESELLEAAEALEDEVSAQQARVAAAEQAVAAADREVAEATAQLEETKQVVAQIHDSLVKRAVKAYMSPADDDGMNDIAPAGDLAEGARRRTLLESVAASDDDLLDELAAAREDYELQQAAATAAKERADARRSESRERLLTLEKRQAEAAEKRAAVTARRNEVLGEIAAHEQADAALRKIIAESDARAAREAARRATVSGGGGGGSGGTRAGGCIWPARGRVTSEYGSRWGRRHEGIDIGASIGTPIWAAKSGLVIFAGAQSGYGNTVIIDHGDMTTLYGHQSRIYVRRGQSVGQGERIGAVGNTGRSTGPHLHFETRYGGSPRNPRGCLG